jgi:hypothetical protein
MIAYSASASGYQHVAGTVYATVVSGNQFYVTAIHEPAKGIQHA